MRQSKCLYIIYTGNFLNRVLTIFSFPFTSERKFFLCVLSKMHADFWTCNHFTIALFQLDNHNHPTASNYAPNKWMTYKPAVHIYFKKMCKKHTQFTFPKIFLKDSSSFVFMVAGGHRNVAIPTSWQEMASCCEMKFSPIIP